MDVGGSESHGDHSGEPHDDFYDALHGAWGPTGWVPPEDRLWRHPSELGGSKPSGLSPSGRSSGKRHQLGRGFPDGRSPLLPRTQGGPKAGGGLALAGAAALCAAVIAGLFLVGPGDGKIVVSGDALVTSTTLNVDSSLAAGIAPGWGTSQGQIQVQRSLVAMSAQINGTTVLAGGVVLDSDLVVTAASGPLFGVGRISVTSSDGSEIPATLVGQDLTGGISLYRLLGMLPSANFAGFDEGRVSAGSIAMVACACTLGDAATSGHVANSSSAHGAVPAVIEGSGPSVLGTDQELVDAIATNVVDGQGTPGAGMLIGSVLIDADGDVLGIFAGQGSSGGRTFDLYVPAPLATGLALELASSAKPHHGWLGITGANVADGTCGVLVEAVAPASPAARAGITPGSVVDGLDGDQVCSIGEFDARVYLQQPAQLVLLEVNRGDADTPVLVTLSSTSH